MFIEAVHVHIKIDNSNLKYCVIGHLGQETEKKVQKFKTVTFNLLLSNRRKCEIPTDSFVSSVTPTHRAQKRSIPEFQR